MSTRKVVLIVILVVAILLAVVGITFGVFFYRGNNKNTNKEQEEKFYITLDDMYCNIKESKKIVKVKITVEVTNKDTFEILDNKKFLIRDEINKIIRNKKEEELQGGEGQLKLQNEIKDSLVKLFDDKCITNVYFDDLIIQ